MNIGYTKQFVDEISRERANYSNNACYFPGLGSLEREYNECDKNNFTFLALWKM